ncbi:hypothetical protein MC7420_7373 [Coleofasciculus chthonoplastes PCC 7420]|uniref:Uncharacterized protein n=1 Tax=Coleofasciculus chthonoplastes PCC 7420 TaxID=118168 RepID=B4VI83_9CYAN|nr:hypothetical protein MC7420_7373 [Coleofasciculus chthonoplastes PCC 7420]
MFSGAKLAFNGDGNPDGGFVTGVTEQFTESIALVQMSGVSNLERVTVTGTQRLRRDRPLHLNS